MNKLTDTNQFSPEVLDLLEACISWKETYECVQYINALTPCHRHDKELMSIAWSNLALKIINIYCQNYGDENYKIYLKTFFVDELIKGLTFYYSED